MKMEVRFPPGMLTFDRTLVGRAMAHAGRLVMNAARQIARNSQGSGRLYYRDGKLHHASAPGEAPAKQTGYLANHLTSKVTKNRMGVRVTGNAYYALALEAGATGGGGKQRGKANRTGEQRTTRHMEPRPFLSTALEQETPNVERFLHQAIIQGIEFGKKKR